MMHVWRFLAGRIPAAADPAASPGWPSRLAALIGVGACLTALVLVLDLAAAGLLKGWHTPYRAASVVAGPDRVQGSVQLKFTVAKQSLTGVYTLTVPARSAIVSRLEFGENLDTSLGDYVGALTVGGRPVQFQPPAVVVNATDSFATITIASDPVPLVDKLTPVLISPAMPRYLAPAEVTVASAPGVRIIATQMPTSQDASSTTFGQVDGALSFTVQSVKVAPAPAAVAVDNRAASDRAANWSAAAAISDLVPLGTAKLSLTLRNNRVDAQLSLVLPDLDPPGEQPKTLRAALADYTLTEDRHYFSELLGEVIVNGHAIQFGDPTPVASNSNLSTENVFTGSSPTISGRNLQIYLRSPQRDCCRPPLDVTVTAANAQLVVSGQPVSRTSGDQSFIDQVRFPIAISLRLSAAAAVTAASTPGNRFLYRANTIALPGAGPAAYLLALAVPLLLAGWWRRRALEVRGDRVSGALRALLWFLLSAAGAVGLAGVLFRWPPATPVANGLHRLSLWSGGRAPDQLSLAPVIILLVVALGWPAMLARFLPGTAEPAADQLAGVAPGIALDPVPDPPASRLESLLGDLMAALPIGLLAMLLAAGYPQFYRGSGPALLTLGIAVLACASLLWSAVALSGLPVPRIQRLLAVTALAALILVQPLRFDSPALRAVAAISVMVAGIGVLLVTVRLACVLILAHWPLLPACPARLRPLVDDLSRPQLGLLGLVRKHWQFAILVLAGLAVLALPQAHLFGVAAVRLDGWALYTLVGWLARVLLLLFAVAVLAELRQLGRDRSAAFGQDAQLWAALLAVAVLFSPFNRVLYLPLPLIVGYLLFRHWLMLDASTAPMQRRRRILLRVSRKQLVGNAITKGVLLRNLPNGLGRKPKRGAEDSGDDGPPTESQILQNWRRIRVTRQAQELGMALGPRDTPWASGWLLAKYALLVSLPWTLLYYLPHGLGPSLDHQRYVPVAALGLLAINLVQWPVLGFVLGYFYPVIRGSNGLWKGLSLALVYIVPFLLVDLAYDAVGERVYWGPVVLWLLQVFVSSVAVGFLAELRTLTDQEFSWRELPVLHNFGGLAAWGSSIVVALSVAIVTATTSTLGQVVTSQFGSGVKPPGSP